MKNMKPVKRLLGLCLLSLTFTGSSVVAQETSVEERESCDANNMCIIASISIELMDDPQDSSSTDENYVTSIIVDPVTGEETITRTVFEEVVQTNNRVCKKEVKVPRRLYRMIVSVLGGIFNEDEGSHAPALNPTQQSILLLYNSFLQLVQNFDCTESLNDDSDDGDTIITDIPL